MRVLVVDDNEDNLKFLDLILRSAGYQVHAARNGQEALEIARHTSPDIAVSDILMPVMDGFMLCRTWHADPVLRSIPFIFYTATYTSAEDESFALSLGARAFIRKPSEPAEFVARLKNVLGAAPSVGATLEVPSTDGDSFLKLYNERLVRKLEDRSEALARSEKRYRSIFESSKDAIVLADASNGLLLDVNPAGCALVGRTREELVGQQQTLLHPADQSLRYQEIFQQAVRAGGDVLYSDLFVQHASGRLIPVEITASLYDAGDGAVMQGIFRDLTAQHRADAALRRSEEMFRAFFENNPAASYIHAADGRLLACNQAFCNLFGFSDRQQALGVSLDERYLEPKERARFLEELTQRRQLALREAVYKRLDGQLVNVNETVTGIFDAQGQLSEAVGFLTDVTANRRLEEQLRQSQKMEAVGQLAAGVAHDFNNILLAIGVASELLDRTVAEGQPGRNEIVTIRSATERGARLTQELLGFARKSVLEKVPLDPNALIDGLVPMVKRLLPATISVESRTAPDVGFIHADKVQIEQVLVNLCVNARDAMPTGGVLVLKSEPFVFTSEQLSTAHGVKAGRYVLMSVTDTGTGMPPEVRARVFEPFFTTKPQGQGTGLGLAMAYGIIRQHEGVINVYSEVGVGTTIKIYLPMVEPQPTVVEVKVENEIQGGGEVVLVVEDDENVRSGVVAVLQLFGYQVLVAGDGLEALAELQRSDEVALVISDVVMPKMSGPELCRAARTAHPKLPFLFTSGYTEETVQRSFAIDQGIGFLSKPYSIEALGRKVRAILDREREPGQEPDGNAG